MISEENTGQEIKEIESKLNLLKSRKSKLLREIMEMNQ